MPSICTACGETAHTRWSRRLSITLIERYYQCSDPICGHSFKAVEESIETISPSSITEPLQRLPQSSRAKLAAIRIAMRKTAEEQMPLELDS
ncbi:ogr/Delta-like zinc finger family protein [Gulbenkiania mobilis]|uniref:ogr/Delta-like zinc finger family protein n=1 Tax=Gulbenkiania mobilis TaxID=397457 RepID=UPI0006BBE642|nr:ogr/Delta-like zinc finger family protein [Gulbenkiania mobilis]